MGLITHTNQGSVFEKHLIFEIPISTEIELTEKSRPRRRPNGRYQQDFLFVLNLRFCYEQIACFENAIVNLPQGPKK